MGWRAPDLAASCSPTDPSLDQFSGLCEVSVSTPDRTLASGLHALLKHRTQLFLTCQKLRSQASLAAVFYNSPHLHSSSPFPPWLPPSGRSLVAAGSTKSRESRILRFASQLEGSPHILQTCLQVQRLDPAASASSDLCLKPVHTQGERSKSTPTHSRSASLS